MIFAATGHRPQKLGGFDEATYLALCDLARRFLAGRRPDAVVSGMALGWDQAWASAAHDLDIPFIAAVPFKGQESQWPEGSRVRYRALCNLASRVLIVCDGAYTPRKMQKRNEWMVNKCDKLIALWDGSPGGTANCVRYAGQVGKPIENLWLDWHGGVFA